MDDDLFDEICSKAGSQKALAEACGVTVQAVSKWRKVRIPADKVIAVEGLTGISRHRIRSDVFGKPEHAQV